MCVYPLLLFVFLTRAVEINWVHVAILVVPPSLALYGSFTTALRWETFIWSILMYFWTGMGITAGKRQTQHTDCAHSVFPGYHRLWSHRAFSARWIVRMWLVIGGAAAFEGKSILFLFGLFFTLYLGSAKWWCRNHRAHHRYTDTDKDPYNATKGFLVSIRSIFFFLFIFSLVLSPWLDD